MTSKTLLVVLVCVLLPQGMPVAVLEHRKAGSHVASEAGGQRGSERGKRNLFLSSVTSSSLASPGQGATN